MAEIAPILVRSWRCINCSNEKHPCILMMVNCNGSEDTPSNCIHENQQANWEPYKEEFRV